MSALVSAWSLIFPILRRLQGESSTEGPGRAIGATGKTETHLLSHHSSPQGISEWLRVKCGEIDGKRYSWTLSSGASSMFSIADSDGFALVNAETLELPKGSGLNVWIKQAPDWTKRLVYQGSNDPAVERLVSFIRERGGDMVLRSVGSLGGLAAISRGEGHIASCHLLDPEDGSYNDRYILSFPDSRRWQRIRLFRREQGFIVQRGNPKAIESALDLTAEDVVVLNRHPGPFRLPAGRSSHKSRTN
jgi:putative molybdopterin biosynthesis protein